MAEDINTSASFGQAKNDDEELPIIVAQRFLNIFRQLHIFSNEKREAFNKMLLELPQEVKNIFQTLPGGTPLQEYMEDLVQKSKGLAPLAHHEHKKSSTLLQNALETQHETSTVQGNVISGDFAKILANSLAQSNAEIIKELQNSRSAASSDGKVSPSDSGAPMKLVADESFTKIISNALAEAIETSEKKRLEDNKIIARSFMELQENLTKLIEQNEQVKFVSTDNKGGVIPMKGIVDGLVKAQSEFLKETTKSQKDELSSIISTAIKESQKVSTQALVESLKQMNTSGGPAPITYAASSPKGSAATMDTVEQALKAQGKEFSSIISMALKESQKNSAQTIIETLENLKKDSALGSGQGNLKVEEIMRMQANLFRDIARAQNQEFSALISSALKESQKQSTQAIITALSQLQNLPIQTIAIQTPVAANIPQNALPLETTPHNQFNISENTGSNSLSVAPQDSNESSSLIEKYLEKEPLESEDISNQDESENQIDDTATKKKKKKKKKKNKGNEILSEVNISNDTSDNITEPTQNTKAETVPDNTATQAPLSENTKNISQQKDDNPQTTVPEVAQKQKISDETVAKPAANQASSPTLSNSDSKSHTSMLEKLMTISNAFANTSDIKDNDIQDWNWKSDSAADSYADTYSTKSSSFNYDDDGAATTAGNSDSDQDWEWEYEEVPDDAEMSGEEGQDWEWEYEEVPEGAEMSGEEGQDWEWEYEEVPDESITPENTTNEQFYAADNLHDTKDIATPSNTAEPDEYEYNDGASVLDNSLFNLTPEQFAQHSEITLNQLPQLMLLGLEDENFRDPYIENNDNIG